MIINTINLKLYGWEVVVLLGCVYLDNPTIIDYLKEIHCPSDVLHTVETSTHHPHNTGLTYSNMLFRKSIIVVYIADNPALFINTLVHECFHFMCHIFRDNSMLDEEELATLIGDINMLLYKDVEYIIDNFYNNKRYFSNY